MEKVQEIKFQASEATGTKPDMMPDYGDMDSFADTNDNEPGEAAAVGAEAPRPGSATSEDRFSLSALRLSTDYMAAAGVKKVITTVPVRRPPKTAFIRVRPGTEWAFTTVVLEQKEQGEWYVVAKDLWSSIPGELVAVTFYVATTREGTLFLIPSRMPGPDGKMNPWHESLIEALHLAMSSWVRIMANMNLGGYDVLQAQGDIPEPTWPDLDLQKIVDIAFRGRRIDSLDHPVVRSLLGKA